MQNKSSEDRHSDPTLPWRSQSIMMYEEATANTAGDEHLMKLADEPRSPSRKRKRKKKIA